MQPRRAVQIVRHVLRERRCHKYVTSITKLFHSAFWGITALGLWLSHGCGAIEKGRYGVDAVKLSGTDRMAAESLRSCLLTRERDSVDLSLGLSTPSCDSPPFDASRPSLTLWRWPWTVRWTRLLTIVR